MVTSNRQLVKRYAANTNELEDKIIGMYAKGMTCGISRNLAGAVWDRCLSDHFECHHRQGLGAGGKAGKAAH